MKPACFRWLWCCKWEKARRFAVTHRLCRRPKIWTVAVYKATTICAVTIRISLYMNGFRSYIRNYLGQPRNSLWLLGEESIWCLTPCRPALWKWFGVHERYGGIQWCFLYGKDSFPLAMKRQGQSTLICGRGSMWTYKDWMITSLQEVLPNVRSANRCSNVNPIIINQVC